MLVIFTVLATLLPPWLLDFPYLNGVYAVGLWDRGTLPLVSGAEAFAGQRRYYHTRTV